MCTFLLHCKIPFRGHQGLPRKHDQPNRNCITVYDAMQPAVNNQKSNCGGPLESNVFGPEKQPPFFGEVLHDKFLKATCNGGERLSRDNGKRPRCDSGNRSSCDGARQPGPVGAKRSRRCDKRSNRDSAKRPSMAAPSGKGVTVRNSQGVTTPVGKGVTSPSGQGKGTATRRGVKTKVP